MKTNLNSKTSELEIIVAAKREEWIKAQSDVQKNLISELTIKGFRKGKVPVDIAKKHIPQAKIMNESISKLIDALAKQAFDAIAKDIIVLDRPSYLINKVSDVELELKFIYPIFPEFTIGKYKNLDVKFEQKNVDAKTITSEIDKMRSKQALLKEKKGEVAKGDIAVIDYEGFVAGKPFEGGKGEKHQLTIGSNQFIPGFEDQLIGLKANSKKDVNITFPQKYHDEKLKGQKATFKVVLHNVKTKEIPALNDEFVKTAGIPNVATVDQLKKYIKTIFTEQNRQAAVTKFQRQAFDLIAKTSKDLVIPPALLRNEVEQLKKQTLDNIKKQGLDYKKYLEITGMDEEKFAANFAGQAKTRLTDAFLFAKIAKLEKIIVAEADYEAKYQELAKVYYKSVAEIKKMVTKEQMQIPITNERVLQFLIDNAVKKAN